MTKEQGRALLVLAESLGMEVGVDNYGQLIVYSGMMLGGDDPVHTIEDAVLFEER